MVALDGKTVRGTVTGDRRCTHLLAAYAAATGITLAQIPLEAKGGEIAQVKPLVEQVEAVLGNVAGVVFVADALHAQTTHTQDLTARGAALLVTVKANQRALLARLRALPWGRTSRSGTEPATAGTAAGRPAPSKRSPSPPRPGSASLTLPRPSGSPAPAGRPAGPPVRPPT